jgi:ribonuclease HI
MNLTLHIATSGGEAGDAYACGVVVVDQASARPVHEAGYLLGRLESPHVADYRSLIRAIELVLPLKPADVEIRCLSQRLVNQITGAEMVDSAAIEPLYEQTLALLLQLDLWRLTLSTREESRRAMELADHALRQSGDVVRLDTDTAATQQQAKHTGVPQWTVELLEEPGRDCPARCKAGIRYAFGPDTPAGFCVFATSVSLVDGPLNWPDRSQKRMTTVCPHCEVPLQIQIVG